MAEIIRMPKLGFDMAEGTLVRWVIAEGDQVEKGQVLAEIETDKATVEVESSASGRMHRHLVEQNAVVPVGSPIAVIAQPGEEVGDLPGVSGEQQSAAPAVPPNAPAAAETHVVEAPVTSPVSALLSASPLARRMAAEKNIDLRGLTGSGPGGRIVRRDVEAYLAQPAATAATKVSQPAVASPLPAYTAVPAPSDEVLPLDRLRQAIGRRMSESKQQVPHFYVTHEYDLEALTALRKELNAMLPDEQKLSINDFIIKAVALSLRQFPALNASLAGDKVIRHGAVNLGVAVAVEGGLLTVVVRDADVKPLRAISTEVKEMAARVRQGKVRPDDIEGSTFSISNLGMFDVEHFVAIINPPEAAILAIGSARQVPAVIDGAVQIRTRMKATLSADHRVTDGAQAAQFMQLLAGYLEKPLSTLV